MAKLINGNGNPAVYAAEDADLIASIMGDKTSICNLGSKFAATASGANVIEVADGVIITKEGRRIQLDSGSVDEFSIPAGTVGTTNYYIIGYKLYENAQVQQVCETFVQLMPNSTDVIQEDTFKGGATEVYVSLYRVEQDGVNLGTITALLPEIGNISEINTDLSDFKFRVNNGTPQFSIDGGSTWNNLGGSGGMKPDFTRLLHGFNTAGTWTVTEDCLLVGGFLGNPWGSQGSMTINNNQIGLTFGQATSQNAYGYFDGLFVAKGSVIVTEGAQPCLKAFALLS